MPNRRIKASGEDETRSIRPAGSIRASHDASPSPIDSCPSAPRWFDRVASKFLFIGLASLAPGFVAAASLVVDTVGGDGSLSFAFKASSTKYYAAVTDKSAPVVSHDETHWARGKAPSDEEIVAFTVFSVNETDVTDTVLSALLENYLEDDVYIDDFLEGMSHGSWLI